MNRQFSALAGLAMVIIVINHSIYFSSLYPQEWGYPTPVSWIQTLLSVIGSFGWLAVPTFFFISGWFVSYAANGDPPKISIKFLYSALRRIMYPYVIWSIVFYILIYVTKNQSYTLFGYIKNVLVGYPYHFVPLLVFFYIISPLLVRVGRTHGLLIIAVVGLYQLYLINILKPGTLGFDYPVWFHYFAPPVIRTTLAQWGIYFPLGLVWGLNSKRVTPIISKYTHWIIAVTVVLFILANLNEQSIIHFPLSIYLSPLTFVLLLPLIRRDSIPMAKQFERVGKHSYGIYLSHLIVINLVLIGIYLLIPGFFKFSLLLVLFVFVMALFVPLFIMEWNAKSPFKQYYHYVFG